MSDGNCRENSTFIGYFYFKVAVIMVSIVESNPVLWSYGKLCCLVFLFYSSIVSKNTEPKICKAKNFAA